MVDSAQTAVPDLEQLSNFEIAQVLAQRLAIAPSDWHRLKGNRQAQAQQSAAMALVFLLKDRPEDAIAHLQQATGWLDKSVKPLPCPSHGDRSLK
ncbi:MAG: DUF6439 family protein [Jaaginema sp. PMC 1079.18]|nr:DUF6439 family protein [Jaaginema sp. PMC 1080.18]MEC4852391.1 DUF6439 family protein [Jaaginema sp. PMC 1079.18]MEC4867633.1 DUF6439 family protein [Jaaginema sp. PMC 1078.18]